MTPLAVLQEIMKRWPNRSEELNLETLRKRFSGFLTDDFVYSNFANRPFGNFSIFSKELVIGKTAKVLVFDTKDREYPNLAVLEETDDGRWLLKAFLFWCLSCFGTGTCSGDTELCDVCGATGWGLVDYVNGKTAI